MRAGVKRIAALAAGLVGAGLLLAATPYLYSEIAGLLQILHVKAAPGPEHPGQFAARPGAAAGRVVDGWWRVEAIGDGVFALGEPADDPDNYEYLILGSRRALLIDAGTTRRDIRPVLGALTRLPVTVLPTHLHWDHTTGLANFGRAALIDLPATRAIAHDGKVRPGRYAFLGRPLETAPEFAVSQWIRPGETLDLGGREVQVLSTPGHTPTSVSVYLKKEGFLFTGDYIYPTTLYEFSPESSLSAWVATADRLLADLPPTTRLYGAHCCRNDQPPGAPWLSMQDLKDARTAIDGVRGFRAKGGRGVIIRRFPVNDRMTLLTLYPFANW